jgi:prepilin-type N-terminal cleavage/methylation domain-containing protein
MMKKRLSLIQKNSGFTLIEVLLVILLISILAAIGITSFTSFQREAKNATVKANVAILRTGIAKAAALARMRCGQTENWWPTVAILNANSLAAVCSDAQLGTTAAMDRQIVQGAGIPVNPWSHPSTEVASPPTNDDVTACVGTGCTGRANVCAGGAVRTLAAADSFGWCYNTATGDIWANSSRNGLDGTAAASDEYNY